MEPVGPYGQINHFQGQTIPEQLNPYFAYFCVLVHGFLVIQNYLRSQLVPTAKRLIFKVKGAPKQVNPPFYRFSCAIVHEFLVIQNFDIIFAKKILGRPLRPYLWS
ncbi:hypothetical protein H5410_013777 [Solanum commersonii]|uniref:Uncharacterized protein n=1 Tax=Solanum commersonii TaxID=4109 RepID=A0A9J5ZP61_SOLCO|nr:hypothetical protein H5410_013777 [Solanum commersonii]